MTEHPRVCGENLYGRPGVGKTYGTSPRMRGKLARKDRRKRGTRNIPAYAGKPPELRKTQRAFRNIPAYAGKTRSRQDSAHPSKEHPRVRGENCRAFLTETIQPGTSPRARGKPACVLGFGCGSGNIPACAGKTTATRFPHLASTGTSPRARGKLFCHRPEK